MVNVKKNWDCAYSGCVKVYYARGYCNTHYERLRKTGNPATAADLRAQRGPCECGRTEKINADGQCSSCYMRNWYQQQTGTPDHKWYKEEVSYGGAHSRVRATRGFPRQYDCQLCGQGPAETWALSAETPLENLRFGPASTGRKTLSAFSINPDDYLPAHGDCHKVYDSEFANRNYKLQESRWELSHG